MLKNSVNTGITVAQLGTGFTVDPVNRKINMKLTEAVRLSGAEEWEQTKDKCPHVIYHWNGGFAIGSDKVT